MKEMNDINHPPRYKKGSIECIEAIKVAVSNLSGVLAFDIGNAIKYLWRFMDKGGSADLKKAVWYINHAIEELEKNHE